MWSFPVVKLQKRNNKKIFSKRVYNRISITQITHMEKHGQHREFLEFGLKEYLALKNFVKK